METYRNNEPRANPSDPADQAALALRDKETEQQGLPVNKEVIRKWTETLSRYKSGKARLDGRVRSAEKWWKLRNEYEEALATDPKNDGFRAKSAWLHNVIVSKHADALESFPRPNILPREKSDQEMAWALTKIIPVILKQNKFEKTFDQIAWSKLKTGTGVYKVIWDAKKLNGLGDISIKRRDVLNIYWEPGISDIQDSKYVFDLEVVDKDALIAEYPDIDQYNLSTAIIPVRQPTDDAVPLEDKVSVVDVYYKKNGVLHYAKFAGEQLLYATENDPQRADRGLYDHGLYPYVFDVLYPVEGSPAGYGYVDVCANAQTRIDLMNTAFLRNVMAGAMPRFFVRKDGNINEEEFLNLEKAMVHVNGNLGEDNIRPITTDNLSGNHISVLDFTVNELRETSGNTETSTGSTAGGVTAASAIAALQEASGKGSRASTIMSYDAYSDVINLTIELARQFYDLPRQFRVTGNMGVQHFITFSNQGMKPQPQGFLGGQDMGYRLPVFDIDIVPEKKSNYTRMSNNELALQFYGMHFFDPQNVDQSLACMNMMDFDQKDDVMQAISANGTMAQKLALYQQIALGLAQEHDPEMARRLAAEIMGQPAPAARPDVGQLDAEDVSLDNDPNAEAKHVQKARERSATAAQPGGSTA